MLPYFFSVLLLENDEHLFRSLKLALCSCAYYPERGGGGGGGGGGGRGRDTLIFSYIRRLGPIFVGWRGWGSSFFNSNNF